MREVAKCIPWFQYLWSRFQVWGNLLVHVPHVRDEETEALRERVRARNLPKVIQPAAGGPHVQARVFSHNLKIQLP